jgi:hypothetical protein
VKPGTTAEETLKVSGNGRLVTTITTKQHDDVIELEIQTQDAGTHPWVPAESTNYQYTHISLDTETATELRDQLNHMLGDE